MREGSLEAPTRHPLAWKEADFWDQQKAEKELGWHAEVDFESGLKATTEWFCQHWGKPIAAAD